MTREMDYHEKQLSQLKLGRKTVAQTTVEEQQRCRTLSYLQLSSTGAFRKEQLCLKIWNNRGQSRLSL